MVHSGRESLSQCFILCIYWGSKFDQLLFTPLTRLIYLLCYNSYFPRSIVGMRTRGTRIVLTSAIYNWHKTSSRSPIETSGAVS